MHQYSTPTQRPGGRSGTDYRRCLQSRRDGLACALPAGAQERAPCSVQRQENLRSRALAWSLQSPSRHHEELAIVKWRLIKGNLLAVVAIAISSASVAVAASD